MANYYGNFVLLAKKIDFFFWFQGQQFINILGLRSKLVNIWDLECQHFSLNVKIG